MPERTKQNLLRRAVDLAGLEEVARALKASPTLIDAWMNGHAAMPDPKLLVLADFLDKLGRPEKG
jgi:hypothetical protein